MNTAFYFINIDILILNICTTKVIIWFSLDLDCFRFCNGPTSQISSFALCLCHVSVGDQWKMYFPTCHVSKNQFSLKFPIIVELKQCTQNSNWKRIFFKDERRDKNGHSAITLANTGELSKHYSLVNLQPAEVRWVFSVQSVFKLPLCNWITRF